MGSSSFEFENLATDHVCGFWVVEALGDIRGVFSIANLGNCVFQVYKEGVEELFILWSAPLDLFHCEFLALAPNFFLIATLLTLDLPDVDWFCALEYSIFHCFSGLGACLRVWVRTHRGLVHKFWTSVALRPGSAKGKIDLVVVTGSRSFALLPAEADFDSEELGIFAWDLKGLDRESFSFWCLLSLLDRLTFLQLVDAGADHVLRVGVNEFDLVLINSFCHSSGTSAKDWTVFFIRVISCEFCSNRFNWTCLLVERIIFWKTLSLVNHCEFAWTGKTLLGVDWKTCAEHGNFLSALHAAAHVCAQLGLIHNFLK